MTVQDPTTTYGWDLPLDGGATDTWGTEMNEAVGDFEGAIVSVDEVLAALQAALDTFESDLIATQTRIVALQNTSAEAVYVRMDVPDALDPSPFGLDPVIWPFTGPTFEAGGTFYSLSNAERLTIPSEGGYNIASQITLPTFAKGSGDDDRIAWELSIHKNGSSTPLAVSRTPYQEDNMSSNSGDQAFRVATIDDAIAGDYYDVRVSQQTSTDQDSALRRAPSDHFSMSKLPSPVAVPLADMQFGNPMIEDRWSRLDQLGATSTESFWTDIGDGMVFYRPIMVHRGVVIDKMAFGIFSASSGRNNVRLGIYKASSTTGLPETLMGQTPDIELDDSAAKTVFESTLLLPVALKANQLYWYAFMQYNLTPNDTVIPFTYDPENYGPYLGWETSAEAFSESTEERTILQVTPSPLLAGALPAAADLTAMVWLTRSYPSIASHLATVT